MSRWLVRLVVAGVIAASVPLAMSAVAGANTVSPENFTCGVSVFTPCNQTAHFTTPSGTSEPEVGTPSPQATGCPTWIGEDAVVIQGTGNGIEHSIINNALDGWFTSTFTGIVTVTAYTADSNGNPVAPDPNVLPYTGRITQWFGGAFNRNNSVDTSTITFSGKAADGSTITIHLVSHFTSTPPQVGAAPKELNIGHCS